MAVGDVVSDIGTLNVIYNFQPSSGTEVAITTAGAYTAWVYLTNGTSDVNIWNWSTINDTVPPPQKLFINNTNYLRINADPVYQPCYTGIQIK